MFNIAVLAFLVMIPVTGLLTILLGALQPKRPEDELIVPWPAMPDKTAAVEPDDRDDPDSTDGP